MPEDSKKRILRNLYSVKSREEQSTSSPGFNFLKDNNQPLIQTFEKKLTAVKGIFVRCQNKSELQNFIRSFCIDSAIHSVYCIEKPIEELIQNTVKVSYKLTSETKIAVTGCEYLIAQTGSVIVSTAQTHSRQSFVYPPTHIVVAGNNQLIDQLENGLDQITRKYGEQLPSQITTITGPSRTADIEKTLVLGAHGPSKLIIVYLDEKILT